MVQAVFFDFNGVIIDDEPLHQRAFGEALREEGIEQTEAEYFDSLGMDDATFVRAAFERAGRELSDEVLRRVIEREAASHRAALEKELPLFPGVVTFVKALSRRHPLGLVSMAGRDEIDYALARAGLTQHFGIIVSAADVTACKPDPCCYTKALELLNARRGQAQVLPVAAEECLVVEDSPPGIRSARAAGMRTLGVTNTVSDQALRDAGADVVTRSLADWTPDAVHHVFDTDWGRK
ncbi:MAG TPA: HAD family phosphatase [Pyrinomonadaceae bacterium]|jgi:HAD superfamily hydrolase (TIGR01509 family)|nr:HAD family phosphatase [Pyrinomonadaceae bacterium]